MKNFWIKHFPVLAAVALSLPFTVCAQPKILFIGNSFTYSDSDSTNKAMGLGGVPVLFNRLAQAGGKGNPTTAMSAPGGTDFLYHTQDSDALTKISSQQWDYVVLQNYSTEPTHKVDGSHSIARHYTYGTELYRRVMTNNPLTHVILYETWSRSAAHEFITGVSSPTSYASTTEFQTELRINYHGLVNALNAAYPNNPPVIFAPVGDAWEYAGGLRAASDPLHVSLHATDNYHGNDNGYYLSAAVFYATIYGANPHGLSTNSIIKNLNLNLTVAPTLLEDAAWATVTGSNQLQTYLFDFGSPATTTVLGASPNDSTNIWNNVTATIGSSPTAQLTNLVTAQNVPSTLGLAMVSRFNDVNSGGTTTSSLFAPNATVDSLYGNTETLNGLDNVFPSFKLTGLNPSGIYSFTFFGSRVGVTDNRETSYTVTGATSGGATLNTSNNTNNTVMVPGITPTAAGEIVISLSPTANNNSPNHFTYLNAMQMDIAPPQQPLTFVVQPTSQSVHSGEAVTFFSAVAGPPPYFIQWFSNNVPIAGANQLNYTLPAANTNLSGLQYSVSVSNLVYSVVSSNATLTVLPAPAASSLARTFLFDFGGGNTVGFGASPNDPVNYWNNITTTVGGSSSGQQLNLVTTRNIPTSCSLTMVSRFNANNENGTTSFAGFPQNATRDSLYGNTETFNGFANITPSFKITGLSPLARYNFTFYASRAGVTDNREACYTVQGENTGSNVLNAANNVSSVAAVNTIKPNAAGEITVSLTPTVNNNNASHFTYLGIMKIVVVPAFLPPVITQGAVTMSWIGEGQLESAPSVQGPWTPVAPAPNSPYTEIFDSAQCRFFRINAAL